MSIIPTNYNLCNARQNTCLDAGLSPLVFLVVLISGFPDAGLALQVTAQPMMRLKLRQLPLIENLGF